MGKYWYKIKRFISRNCLIRDNDLKFPLDNDRRHFSTTFYFKSYQMGRNLIEDGLAILSIEKEILEELKYKNLISNFAS